MATNRRAAPRYPSWLPGSVAAGSDENAVPVRVVDLSLGGAALEGEFHADTGAPLCLAVEWNELRLAADCVTVSAEEHVLFSIVRVRFNELSDSQRAVVTALVAAMAAEFHDRQVTMLRPGRLRPGNAFPFRQGP
jgi:PilZ domain